MMLMHLLNLLSATGKSTSRIRRIGIHSPQCARTLTFASGEQDSFVNVSGFAVEESFSWDAPFIRGYVFVDAAFQHVIVAIKGTSVTGPFNTPDIIP